MKRGYIILLGLPVALMGGHDLWATTSAMIEASKCLAGGGCSQDQINSTALKFMTIFPFALVWLKAAFWLDRKWRINDVRMEE